MPAITLKNIPDDLYKEIKKNAEINYRSINGEILFRLKQSIGHKKINPNELMAKIDLFHARINVPTLNDELLRETKKLGRP